MIKTFVKAMKGFGKNAESGSRTEVNISTKTVLIGVIAVAVVMWLLPEIPISLSGALIVVVFGFFFASVSSRMVGLVGSSNNPVSGMAIATLIATTIIFKAMGVTGVEGMVAAISVGTVICIIAAIAGDASQDLKTGYIVGAEFAIHAKKTIYTPDGQKDEAGNRSVKYEKDALVSVLQHLKQ